MRVVRDALPRAVRVGLVVTLIFAFDIVFPDMGRIVKVTNAATVGTGICAQTVGSAANVIVSSAGDVCTVRFNASNTWTAPTGVSSMSVVLVGGGGGGGGGSRGFNDGGRGGGGGGGGGGKGDGMKTTRPTPASTPLPAAGQGKGGRGTESMKP